MEKSKIIVRLKDGRVVKGTTNDFFPNKPKFHLSTIDGYIEEFDIEELKAIFFVKTYEGDKSHEYHYSDACLAADVKSGWFLPMARRWLVTPRPTRPTVLVFL